MYKRLMMPEKMGKYKHKTYGAGFAIKVIPQERADDVLHFLITGNLLGSRSLDNVNWKEIEGEEYSKIVRHRANVLSFSMKA